MNGRAFRMRIKPGAAAEYKRRHDQIWPELAELLGDAGIHDYSIFLDETTLDLFAVFKLRPGYGIVDMPGHPIMRRWWDYMADLMEVEADQRPREWPLTRVFHLA